MLRASPSSSSTTSTPWYTVKQLKCFQLFFGMYLTVHFAQLIPYATELFSQNGMISDPKLIPTYNYFPNILNTIDQSSLLLQIFLIGLTCLSILFALRLIAPRCIAFLLWYGWACLLNRNVLISNPGIPYVGFLLLSFSLIKVIKCKEKYNQTNEQELTEKVFPWLYWGSWILYALGYTISGLHKLQSPSWIDGSALHHVLRSPLSRNNALCHFLLDSNPIILKLATWMSLIAEISFLPFGLFYHTRKWYWVAFLALHLGVLMIINFTDLTFGVLTMHFFLLDLRWFFPISTSTYVTKLE